MATQALHYDSQRAGGALAGTLFVGFLSASGEQGFTQDALLILYRNYIWGFP